MLLVRLEALNYTGGHRILLKRLDQKCFSRDFLFLVLDLSLVVLSRKILPAQQIRHPRKFMPSDAAFFCIYLAGSIQKECIFRSFLSCSFFVRLLRWLRAQSTEFSVFDEIRTSQKPLFSSPFIRLTSRLLLHKAEAKKYNT